MSDAMGPLSAPRSYRTIENFITDHWQSSYMACITITNWCGYCHTSNQNSMHFHCHNSLHHDWFISSAASDSHDCFFTFDNSPQHALFLISMLLHAILCFIITAQHDAKWPRNSVWMRMLSPVSLKWYNVTKTSLFPIVFNFLHF